MIIFIKKYLEKIAVVSTVISFCVTGSGTAQADCIQANTDFNDKITALHTTVTGGFAGAQQNGASGAPQMPQVEQDARNQLNSLVNSGCRLSPDYQPARYMGGTDPTISSAGFGGFGGDGNIIMPTVAPPSQNEKIADDPTYDPQQSTIQHSNDDDDDTGSEGH